MPQSRFGTSAAAKKRSSDKRVFEVCACIDAGDERQWRTLAISADSTILDLYLALLGAFEWDGNYDSAERDYRVAFGQRVFADGKGSRKLLRRVFEVGDSFTCDAPEFCISCDVLKSYEVASRRHYPKVLDGGGPRFSPQSATWRAQAAMRRELRVTRALPATSELLEARLHGFLRPSFPAHW